MLQSLKTLKKSKYVIKIKNVITNYKLAFSLVPRF